MNAVLTGDIINSKTAEASEWMETLKNALNILDEDSKYSIFRGDSFQVIQFTSKALESALKIKSAIKTHKHLDVRVSIGIGTVDFRSEVVTQSNGDAFVRSGEGFDQLGTRTLSVKSPWPEFDRDWNTILDIAMLTANKWTPKMAETLNKIFMHNLFTQSEIARQLDKTQGEISRILKRSGYYEFAKLLQLFETQLKKHAGSVP